MLSSLLPPVLAEIPVRVQAVTTRGLSDSLSYSRSDLGRRTGKISTETAQGQSCALGEGREEPAGGGGGGG